LAEGYEVVVPERTVTLGGEERSGWWLVDPVAGATLDQLDDGRGVALSDYTKVVLRVAICSSAGFFLLGVHTALLNAIARDATAGELAWIAAAPLVKVAAVCVGGIPVPENDSAQ
jgi:hypothetical protein